MLSSARSLLCPYFSQAALVNLTARLKNSLNLCSYFANPSNRLNKFKQSNKQDARTIKMRLS